MRDHLLIYLNGLPLQVSGADAFETVSDYLRKRKRLTGTKVVCAEGDCGACAALVGRLSADGTTLKYLPVASCIQTMFQLDLTHLVTIEGLGNSTLPNPVQDSMVKYHGAQCGFCTPGFVVSLYSLMQAGQPVEATGVRRALVGNLCRCTGYDSIVRAAVETDRTRLRPIDAIYPPDKMIARFAAESAQEVRIDAEDRVFFKPVTVESAVAFRSQNPASLIVSGATDLGVQRNKGTRQFMSLLSTAGLKPLRDISTDAGSIHVGGAASLSELEDATKSAIPELSRFLDYFGSPMIKNAATIAGNLVNASPIGDSIPALMVLDAEVELASVKGTRTIPVSQFYTGYRKTVMTDGEILTRVRIPIPGPGVLVGLYKVSKRKDLDISSVSAAIWMRKIGDRIDEIRIAFGGVGPVVTRLFEIEKMLSGKPAALETFEQAAAAAGRAVRPLTDVRGSEAYRRQLVENLMLKFWHDHMGCGAAGSEPVLSVAAMLNR